MLLDVVDLPEANLAAEPARQVLGDVVGATAEHERDLAHVDEREHDDREHTDGHRGAEATGERIREPHPDRQRIAHAGALEGRPADAQGDRRDALGREGGCRERA